MTANRRIFLNIVAAYGSSLYALVIGLFCGWWVLMSMVDNCKIHGKGMSAARQREIDG